MTGVLCTAITVYVWVIIVRIVLEWIRVPSDHPVGRVRVVLAAVTDPVLRPFRALIPPIRLGMGALDLSPLVVIIGLQIIAGFIC